MELCWDEVFFSFDARAGEYELTKSPLLAADLQYRGFSERIPQPHAAPEFFDYQHVSVDPIWPPMGGRLTRYGDVLEVINTADDRSVVMGAGDELSLRFGVPSASPKPGWQRDFILYGVGWDKDADLNTLLGQQIEPLPFRGMRGYPYEPDQSFPDTPLHQRYLRDYQTRQIPVTNFWTQIRDWDTRKENN
jgi:hypothetical protein